MKTISPESMPGAGVRYFVGQSQAFATGGFSKVSRWTTTTTYQGLSLKALGTDNTQDQARALPIWKRSLDLAILVLVAPAFLLFLAVFSLYIKLVSPGPVFFTQDRVGRCGRTFRMLKFRTMHADNDGRVHQEHLAELMKTNRPMTKLDSAGDKRIIPLGRALRSSGLDELPQLINVLRGEMSVVGPRPCTRYEYDLYEPWHRERLSVLPGLTGLWQVSGKNRTTFDEMIRLDIRYSKKLSLKEDVRIIFRTIPALLSQMRDQWGSRRQTAAAGLPRTV